MVHSYVPGPNIAKGAECDPDVLLLRQSLISSRQTKPASCGNQQQRQHETGSRCRAYVASTDRLFGAPWVPSRQAPSGPLITLNAALAPEWTTALDIGRQVVSGDPLPAAAATAAAAGHHWCQRASTGGGHAPLLLGQHSDTAAPTAASTAAPTPAAAALVRAPGSRVCLRGLGPGPRAVATATAAAAASGGGIDLESPRHQHYKPPVQLVVLPGAIQRLGPSTPWRYTAGLLAHSDIKGHQPPLSPGPSRLPHWTTDATTQTTPQHLLLDWQAMQRHTPDAAAAGGGGGGEGSRKHYRPVSAPAAATAAAEKQECSNRSSNGIRALECNPWQLVFKHVKSPHNTHHQQHHQHQQQQQQQWVPSARAAADWLIAAAAASSTAAGAAAVARGRQQWQQCRGGGRPTADQAAAAALAAMRAAAAARRTAAVKFAALGRRAAAVRAEGLAAAAATAAAAGSSDIGSACSCCCRCCCGGGELCGVDSSPQLCDEVGGVSSCKCECNSCGVVGCFGGDSSGSRSRGSSRRHGSNGSNGGRGGGGDESAPHAVVDDSALHDVIPGLAQLLAHESSACSGCSCCEG